MANKKYEERYVNYENIIESINSETGEIVKEIKNIVHKTSKESDYVKVYVGEPSLFTKKEEVGTIFLLEFFNMIEGYIADDSKPWIFRIDTYTKEAMAEKLDLSVSMVGRYFRRLIKSGILVRSKKQSI